MLVVLLLLLLQVSCNNCYIQHCCYMLEILVKSPSNIMELCLEHPCKPSHSLLSSLIHICV